MNVTAELIRLYLLPDVEERIRHYTDLAHGEVSALGLVEEFEGGFLVTDLFLPRQQCSAASTRLKDEAVATLLLELDRSGRDPSLLRFWFHSHGNLGVFWSDTDNQCIEDLANGDYLLSLVVNKRGDALARLDIYKPARVTVDQIPVSVRTRSTGLREVCREEIRACVDEVQHPPHLMDPRFHGNPREFLLPFEEEEGFLRAVDPLEELEDDMLARQLEQEEYEARCAWGEGRHEY